MRIRSSNNILNISLKREQSDSWVDVIAYDKNFQQLSCQTTHMGSNVQKVCIEVSMPNKLMIVFGSACELSGLVLAGINFNLETIPKIIESKFASQDNGVKSPQDFLQYPSSKSKVFGPNSCLIINLFHHDPIAYHLFVGNRIKF